MSAYDKLTALERERVDHEASETLYAAFNAAHCATGWCGDVDEKCWGAGLPVMKETMAKLVLSFCPVRGAHSTSQQEQK